MARMSQNNQNSSIGWLRIVKLDIGWLGWLRIVKSCIGGFRLVKLCIGWLGCFRIVKLCIGCLRIGQIMYWMAQNSDIMYEMAGMAQNS